MYTQQVTGQLDQENQDDEMMADNGDYDWPWLRWPGLPVFSTDVSLGEADQLLAVLQLLLPIVCFLGTGW